MLRDGRGHSGDTGMGTGDMVSWDGVIVSIWLEGLAAVCLVPPSVGFDFRSRQCLPG